MKREFYYILIAALVFVAGCRKAEKVEVKPLIKVETVKARRRALNDRIRAFGEIKAKDEILLSSQFDGRIVSLDVLPGDQVGKGELIAKIRRKEAEAVSLSLKNEFLDLSVFSPASGSVVQKYVSRGDVLSRGQPIVKIIAKGRLYLLLDIPEEFYGKIKIGNKVEFSSDSRNYTGRVEAKSDAVDSLSGTLKVRVSIKNGGILPGVFVNAFIITETKFCTAVPRSAVLTRDNRQFVFVVEAGMARMRYVKTGILTDKFVEIRDGIKPGERVVTLGNYELEDGGRVKNILSSPHSPDAGKKTDKK